MDKAQLLDEIRTERELLERVIGRVDDSSIVEPGVVGEWSIKDVLAHVAFWETTFRGWVAAASRGETPEMPAAGLTWDDVDRLNEQAFQGSRDRALSEVRAEFAASFAPTLALIEAIDEAALLDPKGYFAGHREPLWQFAAANTSDHYREHRESLETWLAGRG